MELFIYLIKINFVLFIFKQFFLHHLVKSSSLPSEHTCLFPKSNSSKPISCPTAKSMVLIDPNSNRPSDLVFVKNELNKKHSELFNSTIHNSKIERNDDFNVVCTESKRSVKNQSSHSNSIISNEAQSLIAKHDLSTNTRARHRHHHPSSSSSSSSKSSSFSSASATLSRPHNVVDNDEFDLGDGLPIGFDPLKSLIKASLCSRFLNDVIVFLGWSILIFLFCYCKLLYIMTGQSYIQIIVIWSSVVCGILCHYIWPHLRKVILMIIVCFFF